MKDLYKNSNPKKNIEATKNVQQGYENELELSDEALSDVAGGMIIDHNAALVRSHHLTELQTSRSGSIGITGVPVVNKAAADAAGIAIRERMKGQISEANKI